MSALKRRKPIDVEIVEMLESATGYRREVCEAMAMRGIDSKDKALSFIHPFIKNLTPYEKYSGMIEAAERIRQAIEYKEKVVIYGDYDCDGVCATAILYLMLKKCGIEVDYYIPIRKKEGYGINREALEQIAEEMFPDLIITVDCGITAAEDIGYVMEELGIDVIVTDHHEPPDVLPDCIVVDPKVEMREDCFNELCGAGVALRLVEALGGVNEMMLYIDIACLATIADIVPLISDNRIIVNHGIDIINARARQSMKLLLDLSYPDDRNKIVNSSDIAYRIVPKINAVGRLADSRKSVELFTEDDYFYAKSLVESAVECNKERQRLTEEVYHDCLYKLESYNFNRRIIVLSSDKWEIGVLGIACSKLVNDFNRPVILLQNNNGICKGSCRSIKGVNLYEAIKASSVCLDGYGGHAMACGITVNEKNIELFIDAIDEYLNSLPLENFLPEAIYDIEIAPEEFTVKLMEDMSVLEPFGEGNPTIQYLINANKCERIGRTQHAKIVLNDEGELIGYGCYNKYKALGGSDGINYVAGGVNTVYQNRRFAQGVIAVCDYDATKYDGYAEYIAARYSYQLSYGDNSLFAIENADDAKIIDLLNNSIYGTCILCYNIDTYRRAIVRYGEHVVRKDITFIREINPYNRIVLDINANENLLFYDNVVLMDKPFKDGLADELRLNRDCRVFLAADADKGNVETRDLLRLKIPDTDRMRLIYSAILSQTRKKDFCSLSELFDATVPEFNAIEFYAAAYTFYELKLLAFANGALRVNTGIRTQLEKSVYYSRLLALQDGMRS